MSAEFILIDKDIYMAFTYGEISGDNAVSSYDKIKMALRVAKIIKQIPDSLELFREHHFALVIYVLDTSHKYHLFTYSAGVNPKFSWLEDQQREIEDIVKLDGRVDQLWFDIL
jgi:hypothetical protein